MGQTQFRSDDTVKWWLGFGDGSDGDYSSAGNATDAPIDSSCSGTAGATSLSATNASFAAGKPVLIHQTRGTGAGNWELNQIDSYTAGTITLKKPLQNTYTDSGASQAQVIQLKQYNNFTQNAGHTLTAKAWDGNVSGIIAFLAKGTVTITGSISGNGGNGITGTNNTNGTYAGGTGGFSGGSCVINKSSVASGYQGESYGGVGGQSTGANGGGGGGGSVSGGGNASGGGGGYGSSGGTGGKNSGTAGSGGGTYGSASLTVLHQGSGGGGGATADGYAATGGGGAGGKIIAIFCKDIVINGSITSNGGNGGDQSYDDHSGGGGSGGSILLKFQTATLGTNKITASGGTGRLGSGGVGRIHLDYSDSYTGTTTPTLNVTLDPTIIPVSGSKPLFFAQY